MGLGMEARNTLASKIQGAELSRMALEGTGGPTGVIIEVEAPTPKVHVASEWLRSGEHPSKRFVEESAEQQQAVQDAVEKAGAFLKETLGETPQWLRAARAFVAEVTPDQLRIVASSPLIKAIRPNRRLDSISS